jgi:hypothetical protein
MVHTQELVLPEALQALPAQTPPHLMASLARLEHLQELLTRQTPVQANAQAWDRFLSLGTQMQAEIEGSWNSQSSLLEAAMRSGLSAANEESILRLALERNGLELSPALLASIEAGSSIELERWDLVIAYRSSGHYAYGRYSLVELDSFPRNSLYSFADAASGGQVMREKLTEGKRSFVLLEKLRARLVSTLTGEPFTLRVAQATPLHN